MDRNSLQEMTVAELREEAKKVPDAKGLSGMKKDELVEFILAHAGGEPAPAGGGKTAAARPHGDRGALKQRIRELKKERNEAMSRADRERAGECSREIHRCKRRLRKLIRHAR